MDQTLIQLQELSKYYTQSQSVAVGLDGVSLRFSRGEFVAVTGESGSGKSTLAHVLGGIAPYESGELYFAGKPTSHYDSADWERYRRDNISFISQSYGILPGATVLGNVVTALRLSGMEKSAAKAAAKDILTQVELWDLRSRRAAKLSSGQKQRLSIARALAKPAPILIADEPTGNLDTENSAKIISLLSKAAESRLVILVTHEFSEAEAFVTRHIRLRGGKVVMDVPLRAPHSLEAPPAPEKNTSLRASAHTGAAARKAPILSPHIAAVQLYSRPIWSMILTAIFTLTAFAVFAFCGTFIIHLDDTDTRIYDNTAFRNGDKTRIVVSRSDGAALTDADLQAILALDHVTRVEKRGQVADVYYAYREGVDYRTIYTEHEAMFMDNWVTSSLRMNASAPFMQTVPQLPEGETFLAEGRLPEGFYEAVSADPDLAVGDSVRVLLYDANRWNNHEYFSITVTVVGTTGYGKGLYFADDVGFFFAHNNLTGYRSFCFTPDDTLTDTEFRVSETMYTALVARTGSDTAPITLPFAIPGSGDTLTLTLAEDPYTGQPNHFLVTVSPANFTLLSPATGSVQCSVTLESYGYTDRVLDDLKGMDYIALSPYRQGATEVDTEKAAQREQTLRLCAIATAVLVLLQVILLRAMYQAQFGTYRLLGDLGLTASTANLSALWQVLGLTVLGQLLGAALIAFCAAQGVQRILDILYYLPIKYVLLLSALHMTLSLTAAAWVMTALRRQVFPHAAKYRDIALGEEV